jgi:AraC family transcriptional regulator
MNFQGRRVPFFSGSDFNSADHPWAGYSFEEGLSKAEPLRSHAWPKTTIFLCTGGEHGTVSFKHRGVWTNDRVRPGYLFMARPDAEIQERRATHVWPVMVLQLDSSKLVHMAPEQMHAIERSLVSMLGTRDDRLTTLLQAVREEVREGCPSGRLYAESMSLALLAYLAGRYASSRHVDDSETPLSRDQRRGLVDYVRANLASNISVTELAGLVQMSPSHFARVFKASFGVTPYRFVMQERIEGAKDMLATAKLSASQVGTAFGFSSQSHFVKVFRQFTGVTPKQYKAGR